MIVGTEKEIADIAREVKSLRTKYLKAQRESNRCLAEFKRAQEDLWEIT